jgi:hypothetical protein
MAQYLQGLFHEKLKLKDSVQAIGNEKIKPPKSYSLTFVYECERVTDILVKAFQEQCKFILTY